jgi:hypothetical protein
LICLSFCQPIGCCLGCLYICLHGVQSLVFLSARLLSYLQNTNNLKWPSLPQSTTIKLSIIYCLSRKII